MNLLNRAACVWPLLRVGAGALSFLTAFCVTSTSHAIPAPMPIEDRIYLESTQFVSGGVIVGRLECYTELCSDEALVFLDAVQPDISGQFVDVSGTLGAGYFAFLPDVPLAPGTYWIDLRSGTLAGFVEFEITEASTALPSVSVVSFNPSTPDGARVDCLALASTALEQGFYESARYQASVSATVTGATANQYIFDLRLAGDEANRFMGRTLVRTAEGEPSEVCFEVFGRPIVGGDDVSLTEDCLSTDGLTLGVVEEISVGMESALRLCTVPPDGYFDEWCAAFAEQFVAQSCVGTHPEACFAARQDCPEGDHPTDEEVEDALNGTGGALMGTGGAGTGGDGVSGTGAENGTGAANGTGSAAGDGDAVPMNGEGSASGSSSDSDENASDVGGCSASTTRGGPFGASWVLLLGILLAFSRRCTTRESSGGQTARF